MSNLSGRTALIIGGMHVLAADAAVGLQEAGSDLVFIHRKEDASAAGDLVLRLAGKGARPQALASSFTDRQKVAEIVDRLERAEIAILSPGWHAYQPFLALTPAAVDNAIRQNVEEMTYALQAVLSKMIKDGSDGRIVLLSSVHSLWPAEQTSLLASSLAAMHVIAQMAAVDAAVHGITVNILAAGWRRSAATEPLLATAGEAVVEAIPATRLAHTRDFGAACVFLASPAAAYITGAILPVDGGYLLTKSVGENPFLA